MKWHLRLALALETVVHVVEITDPLEARRAKYAQYSGYEKTLTLGSRVFRGRVQSVSQDYSDPLKWVVRIISSPKHEPALAREL
jgi:hypothetical protein